MKKAFVFAVMISVASSVTASATRQFGVHGFGPRVGATIDPDQFHFGGHLDLGDLAPKLMLFPNIEIGVGNDLTVVAPTFELDYRFRQDWGSWNPYLGAGIGPVFYSVNTRHGDHSSTELGLNIQGGIATRLTGKSGFFFLEMKLGLADAPDIKFTVGWNFGR